MISILRVQRVLFKGAGVRLIHHTLAWSLLFWTTQGWSAPKPTIVKRASPQTSSAVSAVVSYEGKIVAQIAFKGLKRIEKDAVQGKIQSKSGQRIQAEVIRSDIQSLFSMGFFDEIEVQAETVDSERVNLIYQLKERPAIARINFEGNERITSSDLKDAIKLKEWSILDMNKVREDAQLIQKQYEEKGFYLVKVAFDVKVLSEDASDQVELTYKINDFDKVQIKKITFLNNKRFTDEHLKSVFQETKEGGLFNFLSGSGNFKESAFKMDLQRLTFWYLENGYVKFRYENPVVTISDDKRWLFISVYVDEGEQYKMGALDFSGDLLFSKEELAETLTLKKEDRFSLTKRNADIQTLTEKYEDLGYAYANVIPKMNIHDDTKTVDIEYSFEKGNLVYFGEINVLGNTKTHDKVIRRELKIHEGELFNGTKFRQSRENVERLGFFQPGEVVFNKVTPKGQPDVMNVEISVKERSTGTITLGMGYGSNQGFFFTATVAEINFLGRGQDIRLQTQYAADRLSKTFNLGFTDPYAFDTRWSMGGELIYTNMPIPEQYLIRKMGFNIHFGYPLAEFVNAFITYKNEGVQTEALNGVPYDETRAQDDAGVLSSIVWRVVRDKRNNRFEPTDGSYQSVSLETAGLGGDKQFLKWNLNNRYYRRVIGDLIFRTSFETGAVHKTGEKPIPLSERFFLGGPNNMKGFKFFGLSPVGTDKYGNLKYIGGTFEAFSLFELEYPLIREAGLKWVTFFDVGNAWDHWPRGDEPFEIRADWGFGIRWFSPIGPLRFEWGFPINPKSGEIVPAFHFFIGPPF